MAEVAAASEQPRQVKTKVALAKAVGLSRRHLDRLSKEDWFPSPKPNGSWDVEEVKAALAANGKRVSELGVDSKKPTNTELKARLLDLQGKKLAVQVAALRKKYIDIADAQKAIGDMIGEAKKVLLGGPSSLAPQVVGVPVAEAEKLLRDWLQDALSRLSENPTGAK